MFKISRAYCLSLSLLLCSGLFASGQSPIAQPDSRQTELAVVPGQPFREGRDTAKPESKRPVKAIKQSVAEVVALDEKMERRAEISTTPAHLRILTDSNKFSATVEPTTEGSGIVTSSIMGVVSSVKADVGQSVKKGQILAYISCPDLSDAQSNYLNAIAKLHESQAQIELAINRVDLVRQEVERLKTLNDMGIAALKDVQLAQGKLASTQSELTACRSLQKAAQAHVAAAKARLAAFGINADQVKNENVSNLLPIRSPISGVVTQKSIHPGQLIGPGISYATSQATSSAGVVQQASLFTVVNLDKVWVILEVPQVDVSHLKIGMPILFISEVAPGRTFKGTITKLGENFDPQWRTVSVRAEILNPGRVLKPGMLVIAETFAQKEGGAALVVPNSALQSVNAKPVVFVKTGRHQYKLRYVKLGHRTAEYCQIVDGLAPGEHVVSRGAFFVKSEALKATISGAK